MNRKNTILLAVLINAGLLLVLFVTALSSKDEAELPAVAAKATVQESVPAPLFGGEELDLALRQEPTMSSPLAAESIPTTPAPIVHALPPLAAVEAPPAPAAAPVAPLAAAPVPAAATPREVVVKKGDSLEKIAKAHRTSVDELLKLNHLSSSFLRVGQVIKVPLQGAAVTSSPKPAVASRDAEYYVVKVGDTPWTIAMKHHLKVDELLKLNGLNEREAKKLKAGDRLRIR